MLTYKIDYLRINNFCYNINNDIGFLAYKNVCLIKVSVYEKVY